MGTRDSYVDFLRALGFISIMMVHSSITSELYLINLFNVPLMVVVSGLVSKSSTKRNYRSYVLARLKRLLIPTWIFITAYLIFLYVLTQCRLINYFNFSVKSILYSYLLLDSESGGIGFVWIIRVFLLTMLVTPFIQKAYNKLNGGGYSLCILGLISFQLVLCQFACNSILYNQYLLYFIGYQVFIWFGIGIKEIQKRNLFFLTLVLMCIMIILLLYRIAICKADVLSLNFKTPPYLDYQIYGMTVSSLLWSLRNVLKHVADFRVMKFIGQNTIWLYFWHIPIIISLNSVLKNYHWSIIFIITFILSCSLYYIQYSIVKKTNNNFLNKYLIG